MIRELDEKSFKECVEDAPGREIVEFYSSSAKDSNEALETAAAETAGQTDFFRVDVDKLPLIANKYVKGTTPHYVLFEDGLAISNANGKLDAVQLEKMSTVGEYGAD